MNNFCDKSLTQLDWILNTGPHGCQTTEKPANSSIACYSSINRKNDQNFRDLNIKPPYSYAKLILLAIKSQEDGRATLNQIYQFITTNFKFYRDQPANSSWKNSIRHNLSLNKTFKKISRSKDNPGKGCYWALNDDQDVERSKKDYCFSKKSSIDRALDNGHGPRINPQFQRLLDQISTVESSNNDQMNFLPRKCIDPDPVDQDTKEILSFSSIRMDDANLWSDVQIVEDKLVNEISSASTSTNQASCESAQHERDLSLSFSIKGDEFSSWFILPDHQKDDQNINDCNNEIEDEFDWDSLLAKN